MRLVIMGTPGAGKGTQAKLLAERVGACHISTGDMLRDAIRRGTRLGREAQRSVEQGQLVPDEVVNGIVGERVAAPDCGPGFLLDGFPRTVAQARALDAVLARRGEPLDRVILIAVPREEAVRRLAGRRVCEQCGTMTQRSGRCDRCGGRLVQREDDREETIRHRMDVYAKETAPVLDHYRAAGLLREIDGTGSPEDVARRVAGAVA